MTTIISVTVLGLLIIGALFFIAILIQDALFASGRRSYLIGVGVPTAFIVVGVITMTLLTWWLLS